MPGPPKQTLSFAPGGGGEGFQSSWVLGLAPRGPTLATFKTSPQRESRGPEMGSDLPTPHSRKEIELGLALHPDPSFPIEFPAVHGKWLLWG